MDILLVVSNSLLQQKLAANLPPDFAVRRVASPAAAAAHLRTTRAEAVVLGWSGDESDGLAAARALREAAPGVPIVLVGPPGSPESAARYVAAGADDYLAEPELTSATLKRALLVAAARRKNSVPSCDDGDGAAAPRCAQRALALAARDLYDPISRIGHLAGVLSDGLVGNLNAGQGKHAERIARLAEDCQWLIEDLIDYCRLDQSRPDRRREVSPDELLGHVAERLQPRANLSHVDLSVFAPENLPGVRCNVQQVARTLSRLAAHAIHSAGHGGHVALRARADWLDGCVAIDLSDDGPGISPEHLEAILGRAAQSQQGPSWDSRLAMSLAIAERIIAANGGMMNVESRPGLGTTIHVLLPAAAKVALAEETRTPETVSAPALATQSAGGVPRPKLLKHPAAARSLASA
ncbi:MAG: HAMP domain-containing histidine kinase [Planctomycetia bacterium]|nr:HAMP domain-containing histidine kinase [Planctomycetia bacterium]